MNKLEKLWKKLSAASLPHAFATRITIEIRNMFAMRAIGMEENTKNDLFFIGPLTRYAKRTERVNKATIDCRPEQPLSMIKLYPGI